MPSEYSVNFSSHSFSNLFFFSSGKSFKNGSLANPPSMPLNFNATFLLVIPPYLCNRKRKE